jgi:predicted ester cyclase
VCHLCPRRILDTFSLMVDYGGRPPGKGRLFSVFPDRRFDIEDAVADGDKVAVRGTCSATHEGELWGILPTGERFAVEQVHWFRVADGKVAEHWAVRDDLGLMRQIGAIPAK